MIALVFFTFLAIAALGWAFIGDMPKIARIALVFMAPLLFLVGFFIGSSVIVPSDSTGVVTKLVGSPLPEGNIVARAGEQGPQAAILGPGWHFGYIPGIADVEITKVQTIGPGEVGLVTALDGAAIGDGEVFARSWESADQMLDPVTFLSKGGQKGPQTTILSPGVWRYNPRLHQISTIQRLTVAPGTVAVVKSNTGAVSGTLGVILVNDVPLVASNQRGIWRDPLLPGAYNLNTNAFAPTIVRTTQRIYTYQQAIARQKVNQKANPNGAQDWSVTVRSKDGFAFPVDVRVACAVEARNAPYLVALLADPDRSFRDDQEDEELEVLEAKVILPAVRAIFRNVAETMGALEFVNARSTIERVATERMRVELAKFRVTCDGVYVGQIHLDATDAGKVLIATQTDKEVAVNQQNLYAEQKKAQDSRAVLVRASEEAEQQRNLIQATYEVQVKEQRAKARTAEAKGEADYQTITGEGRAKAYALMVQALGRESVAQLELLKLVAEGRIQITPQVMVGGQGSTLDALAGTMLRSSLILPPAKKEDAKP